MAESQKHWGVTGSISFARPTEEEVSANAALIEELKAQGSFESAEESQRRVKVLAELQQLTLEFVQKVSLNKNMTESMAKEAGGKIFTFGSYRLGVYGPGSDIDTLVVVPKHVTREDFFNVFENMLRQRPEVGELAPVPDAFVPIIKFKWDSISIDLIFGRLALPRVPMDLELADSSILKGLDEACLKSLNGPRVTDEILRLVPNSSVFKHALRAVKLWAKKRAAYGNVIGFPAGVQLAILVARICQLYPNAVSAVIVTKMFKIFAEWRWPLPIYLKQIEEGDGSHKVWNPKIYASDRAHRMPVITPAYPSMCATHNVTRSTLEVITNEFARAADISEKIMRGKLPWSALLVKHDFFLRYKYYLAITAASKSPETQVKWQGFVESKIRQLLMRIEMVEGIILAHPFNSSFDKVYYCTTDDEAAQVATGEAIQHLRAESTNLQKTALAAESGIDSVKETDGVAHAPNANIAVYTSTFYIGLNISLKDAVTGETRKLDISWPSQEFYDICRHSPGYVEESMNVSIKHIRNFELPDDVFYDGQSRPTKATKKPKKRVHATIDSGDSVITPARISDSTRGSGIGIKATETLSCCIHRNITQITWDTTSNAKVPETESELVPTIIDSHIQQLISSLQPFS